MRIGKFFSNCAKNKKIHGSGYRNRYATAFTPHNRNRDTATVTATATAFQNLAPYRDHQGVLLAVSSKETITWEIAPSSQDKLRLSQDSHSGGALNPHQVLIRQLEIQSPNQLCFAQEIGPRERGIEHVTLGLKLQVLTTIPPTLGLNFMYPLIH
ncbi:unnamed protein product [Camellia sinensis]